ncbi:MAG: hypothetical protein AUK36_09420 [Zetaproteobacteria bacterium CG2_30_59_37]|nr:MAG: hypothetical protein AUK36_09420 [Zetaproteobacteria bacterium CG2_30_59_37]
MDAFPAMNDTLLVLDLDETLMHATELQLGVPHDFGVERYFMYKRPHVAEFIDFCRERFRLAVWTSSTADYATAVVNELFGGPDELAFLYSRGHCVTKMDPETYEPVYIKDLKKLRNKGLNLGRVIVLDDSPEKLQRNYGNLLRIAPFFGDPSDRELLHVMPFLDRLRTEENIRRVEKRHWRNTR